MRIFEIGVNLTSLQFSHRTWEFRFQLLSIAQETGIPIHDVPKETSPPLTHSNQKANPLSTVWHCQIQLSPADLSQPFCSICIPRSFGYSPSPAPSVSGHCLIPMLWVLGFPWSRSMVEGFLPSRECSWTAGGGISPRRGEEQSHFSRILPMD